MATPPVPVGAGTWAPARAHQPTHLLLRRLLSVVKHAAAQTLHEHLVLLVFGLLLLHGGRPQWALLPPPQWLGAVPTAPTTAVPTAHHR
jgi:hypothetical protein